jgi:ABC-type polysaccharide/polyol phosphate transport system ATPase subunit
MDIIRFQSVTKTFTINAQRTLVRSHLSRLLYERGQARFVALRNVCFTIPKGQTVGVIGSNGAGKSTLLCLLCGLCPPDSGSVAVDGRIAALLQLGAGFHHDLTGAENLRLNAAMLGLSRKRTAELFDTIVEFSGIGQFIHEPLRTYSSGMSMRLAFSIAVHVDPDILVIDEVLSVGDQTFQVKCLEKIHEFKQLGKTLVFVSHAAGSVQSLCERALWLDHGELVMDGHAAEVVAAYEGQLQGLVKPEETVT